MTSDLLPCPFCGPAEHEQHKPTIMRDADHTHKFFVSCPMCGSDGPERQSQRKAINAWNTRPAPAGMAEIVAAAAAMVEAERNIFHAGSETQADDAAHEIDAARARFLALVAAHEAEVARIAAVVDEQANDPGLWFQAETAAEAYVQQALRRIHAAIEGKTPEECAAAALRRRVTGG